jgi:hypothetical protein
MAEQAVDCRSCNAVIFFAMNKKTGKKIPIDVEPNSKGNVLVEGNGMCSILNKTEQALAVDSGLILHISHFATCPNAGRFRRS